MNNMLDGLMKMFGGGGGGGGGADLGKALGLGTGGGFLGALQNPSALSLLGMLRGAGQQPRAAAPAAATPAPAAPAQPPAAPPGMGMGGLFAGMPPEIIDKIRSVLSNLPAPGQEPMMRSGGMPMARVPMPDPGAGAPNVTNVPMTPPGLPVASGHNPWLDNLLKSLPPLAHSQGGGGAMPAQPPAGAMPGFPYNPNPIGRWGGRTDI